MSTNSFQNTKIMANTSLVGNGAPRSSGIPFNVTLHAWPIPKIDTNLNYFNETNPVIVKSTENTKNYSYSLHNLNATGYVAVDDDLIDTGFTDVQTFILAGVATVIPLLITVATILGIRFLWKKYRARKGDGYEGVLQKEESSEPLGKLQGYSIPQELKTSESQFTVTLGEDLTNTSSPQLLTPKSNGSVITMTLKNNHLIVETEETVSTLSGIKIESKGTTTKFVTSTVSDFKVDITNEKTTKYNNESSQWCSLERNGSSDDILSSTNHGALVHCPPELEDELDKGSCNTGLSQSDLSISSTESQNPSYRYGNQRGYDSGGYGYPEYSGYSTFANGQSESNPKGPIEHKIYLRSNSLIETNSGSRENENILKDILMSDIQARQNRMDDEEKRFQEEQNVLRNGDISNENKNKASLEKNLCLHQSDISLKSQETQPTQPKNEITQKNKPYLANSSINESCHATNNDS